MKSRLFVFFSFALALGIVSYYLAGALVRRAGPVVVLEPVPVLSPSSEPSPEPVVESVTSYQLGYDRGYRAYMEQQGLEVPATPAVRYVMEEEELDAEQAETALAGSQQALASASDLLARHFPAGEGGDGNPNELPDAPVTL